MEKNPVPKLVLGILVVMIVMPLGDAIKHNWGMALVGLILLATAWYSSIPATVMLLDWQKKTGHRQEFANSKLKRQFFMDSTPMLNFFTAFATIALRIGFNLGSAILGLLILLVLFKSPLYEEWLAEKKPVEPAPK